jgi:protein-tyrosine phosphatase
MERLLAARLGERLLPAELARLDISSAGTWAMVDSPMSPEAAMTLVDLGGDPSRFLGRQLDVEMIKAADLIITATREHRAFVVGAEPRAATRTLTLRELARLLGPVGEDDIEARVEGTDVVHRLRAVVTAALSNRGVVPVGNPTDDDIADPYRRNKAAFVRAANEIEAGLAVLLPFLVGDAPPAAASG